jgi:hypothetical protein
MSIQFFWYIAIGLIFAAFTGVYPKDMVLVFTILMIFIVLFTIWLFVFNSGRSKIIEYGLELNEQGVTFIAYGDRVTVEWVNFEGVKIVNRLPRLIVLKSSNSIDIKFSYYLFSSAQRKKLFDYLDSK